MIQYVKSAYVVSFLCSCLVAQETRVSPDDGPSNYLDYLAIGIRHAAVDRGNQIIIETAAVSILFLQQYDRSMQKYSQKEGLLPKQLSRALNIYGGRQAYPLALLGVGMTSYLRGESMKQGLSKLKYLWTSLIVTATLTETVKWATRRHRPNGSSPTSFPSGHTSGTFALASTLHGLYGWRVGVPFYLVAGLVGVQRIHDNKHWLTDVIGGAALGTAIGKGFGVAFWSEQDLPAASVESGGQNVFVLRVVFPLN
ncbi:MAG: phosphatase PAP2 family protein [Candidatus Neomarinimicrobiota bacterium]